MHSATISNSDRLRRVLDVLADREEHTTLDVMIGANVCAVSACVSELRDNGYAISCQRRGDLWFYRLEAEATCTA